MERPEAVPDETPVAELPQRDPLDQPLTLRELASIFEEAYVTYNDIRLKILRDIVARRISPRESSDGRGHAG